MFHTEKDKLSLLFLLITTVGAAHMVEQLIFGIEEYYMLRDAVGGWYTLFPESMNGEASVVLITIVFCSVSLILYAVMRGGAAQLAVYALFGVFGLQEAHHWIEAIASGGYDSGLVTSFAYVAVGAWILVEVAREFSGRTQGA